ncbi:MAG: NAD(P)/FAD-dependent oxidoreductase [Pirellulales bacterium]|nr:NAD(P)/FAD-dependent oxidoreductase [Pirellulales bacterium]
MDARYDVIVIGAGAAGLLAAARAGERGRRTLLVERNRKPGVKILMSGGTRCNLTHAATARGIVDAFGAAGRFLHSALAALSPDDLVAMFEAEGLPTKVESTGKVFPVSDRALDVLAALRRMLARSGAELRLGAAVVNIVREAPAGAGFIVHSEHAAYRADKLIITVGGQSYPGCGTCGDGYAWARSLGHRIIPPRPALVPLLSPESWVHQLRGVTLPDVALEMVDAREGRDSFATSDPSHPSTPPVAKASRPWPTERSRTRGSFLFTHFGLSGPAPMDVSRAVTERPHARWQARCDFLPAVSEHDLYERFASEAAANGKRAIVNLLAEWVPRRLAEALMARARLPLDRRAAELSRAERAALVDALKHTAVAISGTLGFKKAEVTAGGVSLDEVDSRTMQSKLLAGLYFAGEILDLDGPIGGYNFQAAFSTGALAGDSV